MCNQRHESSVEVDIVVSIRSGVIRHENEARLRVKLEVTLKLILERSSEAFIELDSIDLTNFDQLAPGVKNEFQFVGDPV